MTCAADPSPDDKSNNSKAKTQMVVYLSNVVSCRLVFEYLFGLMEIIWASVKLATGYLFSLAVSTLPATKSVRLIGILAIFLATISVFFGPMSSHGSGSGRLEALEISLRQLETRLAAPGLSRTDVANPTTLLVAVQFVTAAAERSAPFDTALAVAISMTGRHPKVGPLLDRLVPEAETGVPSRNDLRAEFRERFAELEKQGAFGGIGRMIGAPSFRQLFGLSGSDAGAEKLEFVNRLSAEVSNNELDGALKVVAKLDGRLRDGLEGWRQKVERRVRIDSILAELERAAFIDIIEESS